MIKTSAILLIFIILIVSACSSTPYGIELSRQIINTFSMKMKKVNNLTLIGLGYGGGVSNKLEAFVLRFTSTDHVDVDQARDLFVGLCEDLLIQINTNEKMKPWLSDYPYTGKNLDIILGFNEEPFERVSPPYIALVSIIDGKVYYSTHENDKYTKVLIEPYEEALRIYHERYCISD